MTAARRLLALLWLLLAPGLALAHAQFETSEPAANSILPAPPDAVTLTLNEPAAPVRMRWIAPDGTASPAEATADGLNVRVDPPPDAGEGTYVLSWRVVSLDGHPVSGSLIFSIGVPSAVPSLSSVDLPPLATMAAIAMKLALTIALIVGVGGAVYAIAVLCDGAGFDRLTRAALWLVPPVAALAVAAQGIDLLGLSLWSVFTFAPWITGAGTTFLNTALLSALAAALLLVLIRTRLAQHRAARFGLGLAAWVLAALSFAMSGHSAIAEPAGMAAIAITLHAFALIFWLGALPQILGLLRTDAPLGHLNRFSLIAVPLVLVLLATGFVLTSIHTGPGGFRALATSNYGLLLFVKLVCVAGLLMLALHNRFALMPALAAKEPDARRALRGSIRTEIVLALAILAFASSFRLAPPPASLTEGPKPQIVTLGAGAIKAEVELTPGRAGANAAILRLSQDEVRFDPLEVRLSFAMPETGIGGIAADARRRDDGTWAAGPITLSLPGTWTLGIDVLINDFETEALTGSVEIRP